MIPPKMTVVDAPIVEALYIVEVFDSSYKIGDREEDNPDQSLTDLGNKMDDCHKFKLDSGESGVMTVYKRNGAYEIHHRIEANGKTLSGVINPDSTGAPNPKFIGTMARKAKELLSQGHKVRIVGAIDSKNGTSKTMFDNYKTIGTLIAKHHGYGVSPSEPYTLIHPAAHFYKEFVIHPNLSEAGPVGMIWQLSAAAFKL